MSAARARARLTGAAASAQAKQITQAKKDGIDCVMRRQSRAPGCSDTADARRCDEPI